MGSGFKVRGRFNRFPILHERRILYIYSIKTPRRFFISRRTAPIEPAEPFEPIVPEV